MKAVLLARRYSRDPKVLNSVGGFDLLLATAVCARADAVGLDPGAVGLRRILGGRWSHPLPAPPHWWTPERWL